MRTVFTCLLLVFQASPESCAAQSAQDSNNGVEMSSNPKKHFVCMGVMCVLVSVTLSTLQPLAAAAVASSVQSLCAIVRWMKTLCRSAGRQFALSKLCWHEAPAQSAYVPLMECMCHVGMNALRLHLTLRLGQTLSPSAKASSVSSESRETHTNCLCYTSNQTL